MRLSRKLWLFIILTLVVPMLIIAVYAAWLVYVNTEMAQWRYLDNVYTRIETDIANLEDRYLADSVSIAQMPYVRDKLYVYAKYWDKISPATLAFDIVPLEDHLQQTGLYMDISTLAVYRKSTEGYAKVASFGRPLYLPETIFQNVQGQKFDLPVYYRYTDGIYMQIIREVLADGLPVGAVLLQKGYTAPFFSGYSAQFNVDLALISKNVVLYNSIPENDSSLLHAAAREESEKFKIEMNSIMYYTYSKEFILGNGVSGTLVLYLDAEELQHTGTSIVKKVLPIALGCILIPVVTFLLWGSRLVAGINSLVKATTRVSKGDLEYQVCTGGSDEFAKLQQNFNQMVLVLKKNRGVLESRNMELQLKNSYIDAVFQSLLINIIVIDEKLRIQIVSSNAESKLELPEEYMGEKLFELSPFREKTSFLKPRIESVWKTGTFKRLPPVLLGNANYEIDLYPVCEDGDAIKAVVMVLLNITDRIKMEHALLRSDRLASVGQLAAGIAHEINNPMSVIMNHVQLIQSGKLNKGDEDKFMTRISSEIRRIDGLIDRLLQFSREDSEKKDVTLIIPVLEDILNLFAPKKQEDKDAGKPCTVEEGGFNVGRWTVQYKDRPVNVCLTDTGESHTVLCGVDCLKQLFFNIFKNALQAIHHDFGMIHIHIRSFPKRTVIMLSDNGVGIGEEEMDKIFNPFFTKKRENGTGLGLSLCRNIVERVGGTVTAESDGNRGTTITLCLPGEESIDG